MINSRKNNVNAHTHTWISVNNPLYVRNTMKQHIWELTWYGLKRSCATQCVQRLMP